MRRKGEWQDVAIPLERFLLTWRGRLTEENVPLQTASITSLTISMQRPKMSAVQAAKAGRILRHLAALGQLRLLPSGGERRQPARLSFSRHIHTGTNFHDRISSLSPPSQQERLQLS